MSSELAISEDFEKYDDKEELRRLIRAVQFSQKHYLYFACCNQVPKQNALIAETEKVLGDKKIKVIKFKKPVTDLLSELQKKRIGKRCEAVFVQGLQYSILSDEEGSENALIRNLSISRDTFKKYLPCPLFLWLPEYAIVKITRHAPDFFSVRSGTFYFSNPPEKVTEQIFQSVTSHYFESSSLPLAEKLKQIETLENLLAEYRGLHQEKQDKQAELRLLSTLANIFDSISEFRKEIEYLEKILEISRQVGDRRNEANKLGNLGIAYKNLGEYQKAIEYYNQSLTISREIGNLKGVASSWNNLGNTYHTSGEYQKAINYHKKSLEIFRVTRDQQNEGACLINLGNAYHSLHQQQKAIEYYEKSLKISRKIGDRESEGGILSNLGNAYDSLGEYLKAIGYYEQSITIFRKIGNRRGESGSVNNLANTYNRLGEKDKACSLWKEALTIFESIESPEADDVRQLLKEYCKIDGET